MNEYPPNWKEIAARVKLDAHWRCIRCAHHHDVKAGYVLTVHHLDGDKANVEWWNLAALCQRCHLSVQDRVKMHQGFLFPELHAGWIKLFILGRLEARCRACDGKGWHADTLDAQCADCHGKGWLPTRQASRPRRHPPPQLQFPSNVDRTEYMTTEVFGELAVAYRDRAMKEEAIEDVIVFLPDARVFADSERGKGAWVEARYWIPADVTNGHPDNLKIDGNLGPPRRFDPRDQD